MQIKGNKHPKVENSLVFISTVIMNIIWIKMSNCWATRFYTAWYQHVFMDNFSTRKYKTHFLPLESRHPDTEVERFVLKGPVKYANKCYLAKTYRRPLSILYLLLPAFYSTTSTVTKLCITINVMTEWLGSFYQLFI